MQQTLPLEPSTFERRVIWRNAKNWLKPQAHRNYGHIGMKIIFALIGPDGAITWTLYPRWYVQSSIDAWHGAAPVHEQYGKPDAWDLGYHAYEPQYEEQSCLDCDLLKGGKCYSDGTSLGAKDLIEGFVAGGDEWLWRKLEAVYKHRFHGEPHPDFTPEYEPHPDDRTSHAQEPRHQPLACAQSQCADEAH